jgi:hypothetical protein
LHKVAKEIVIIGVHRETAVVHADDVIQGA